MNYVDIISLIFYIFFTIIGAFYLHFIIFGITGVFFKKSFKPAKTKHTYGIVIACRNEENVIGNLIESVHNTDYPLEKIKIFVIAHNCTDKTAEICRNLGANVIEYNNENEKTKGYALKYGFNQIKEQHLDEGIEGYFIFDADNILAKDYFDKMNDAFEANNCQNIITSYLNIKNFGSSIMAGMYGTYFATSNRFEKRGRTALNCSTRVYGTGYLFNAKVIENGWKYVTLTEDWELTADQILENHKIVYCDEAEFFDEQPNSFKIMWRQRVRWSKGHLLVCLTRFKDLIKAFFSKKEKHKCKVSIYDITQNIMPICLILTFATILQFILLLFAPCFGISLKSTLLTWLLGFGKSCMLTYLGIFLQGIFIFIAERKRIKNVKNKRLLLLSLIWPLFVMLQFAIDIVALFSKNLTWKTIPHNDKTRFEDLGIERKSNSDLSTL